MEVGAAPLYCRVENGKLLNALILKVPHLLPTRGISHWLTFLIGLFLPSLFQPWNWYPPSSFPHSLTSSLSRAIPRNSKLNFSLLFKQNTSLFSLPLSLIYSGHVFTEPKCSIKWIKCFKSTWSDCVNKISNTYVSGSVLSGGGAIFINMDGSIIFWRGFNWRKW